MKINIATAVEHRPLRCHIEKKMGRSETSTASAIVSALRAAANWAAEEDVSEDDWMSAARNAWAERSAVGD